MSTSAQDYIDAFRRGEDFAPPAKNVFANGQPDESAVKLLGEALAKESPNVRENIVKLLVDMARQADPLTAKGADVVRHRRIVEVLAGPGLAQADLGRDAAMEALRKLVPHPDLSRVGEQITMALDKAPTEDAFLLVAKAKPPAAKATVERLIALPRWQNVQAARIANAALGSTASEEPFLRAAADAKTGQALAVAVGPLGLMGTQRSLRLLGELLRTPLTIEIAGHMPGKSIKSARLDVLDALLYNFPDQPVLYPNNINRDEDYRAAERFCTETLGVRYLAPPPPYLKYANVPPEPVQR